MIIDKLIQKITQTGAPIVVGLDPRLDQIPPHIIEDAKSNRWGPLQAAGEAIFSFNKAIIDQIHDIVPAVKPQIAMYEQYGAPGLHAYIRTIDYAKSKDLVVIGDIKRGDIASTAEAYSNFHIGRISVEPVALEKSDNYKLEACQTDFITVNPYMGFDSVEPYFADCRAYNRGLFILVKTSNKGSADLQDLKLENGRTLYQHTGQLVSQWGQEFIGQYGYSSIGAVVGATHPSEGAQLRKAMPHTFFLVPGYGAQGGSGKDLKDLWAKNYGAIVNSSRGITGAYQLDQYKGDDKDFAKASRQAALDMKKDLEAYIS